MKDDLKKINGIFLGLQTILIYVFYYILGLLGGQKKQRKLQYNFQIKTEIFALCDDRFDPVLKSRPPS